jgi:CYTH domain-containing protein
MANREPGEAETCKGADVGDGIEIERKFLLGELPAALAFARRRAILQGYLAIDGDTEVRVRRTPDGSTLTIKHGSGEIRVEEELELGERQADALWELTDGRRLQKVRREMRVEGVDVEVDVYAGALDGLVVAEVEFVDEASARAFEPPPWFGREVTGEPAYANKNLSMFGIPADKTA